MRAAGLAEVERAKADGRWDAAYRQKDVPVPHDLQAALDASAASSSASPTRAFCVRTRPLLRRVCTQKVWHHGGRGARKRVESAAALEQRSSVLDARQHLSPRILRYLRSAGRDVAHSKITVCKPRRCGSQ